MFMLKLLFVFSFLKFNSCWELCKPIDLTWSFENDTLYWKNVRPFRFTLKTRIHQDGYYLALNEFCAGEHGGTHLDAPFHFNRHGLKVGEIPFEKLIVSGFVIDISKEVDMYGANINLERRHLEEWVRHIGRIPKNSVLLVKFGWSKYWPNKPTYFGVDSVGNFHFPGVSEEAARWIVAQKKFVGVGVDVASVDAGNSTEYPAHRILTGSELYILENVKLIKPLPAKGFMLYVMPMKIMWGTGAPLRLAATPKQSFDSDCKNKS